MDVHLNISGSDSVPKRLQKTIAKDAQHIVDQLAGNISEAHFALHVRSHEPKNLVEVNASLITDRGRYFASSEGWRLDSACNDCIESIKTQLRRQTI